MEDNKVNRRSFLSYIGKGSGLVILLSSIGGIGKMFMPKVSPDPSKQFKIGRADTFTKGQVVSFPDKNVLVRYDDGGLVALSMVCTHLGCIVKEEEGLFKCPCHGSQFLENGKVKQGPAPQALKWFKLSKAADGNLVVDTGKSVPVGQYFSV
jgi:cytochrome b6-f complex iron-sulfur subunit